MKLWTHGYLRVSARAHRVLDALRPEAVNSIAVIKHAALGDMVLVRPFLVTLRRHFPNASLTLSVVENYMGGIPEDLVQRVHVSAGKVRPRPSFGYRVRRYRELGHHDLLFDLTASPDSYWLTLLNPAGLKIGFRHSPQTRWLYDVGIPRAFMKFEAESYLDQLGILRVPYDWPLDFGRPPAPAYEGQPFLLYFPTASVPDKCWPAERFGALLGRLADALPGYAHRLLYGVADWEVAVGDTVLAAAQGRPNVAALRDAKGEEFQALVRDATMLVCNDTGVRNLAISYHTPTLGVFPTSLVYTYLPRFGHHAVVHDPDGGQPEVEAVYGAATALLARIEAARGKGT